MRDLDLWRRLADGDADLRPAELLALAAWTPVRRAPMYGRVLPLVAHADPALRAAALRALGGARGVPGVRAIVAALADDDPTVREAALDALRLVARDAPVRFAHALFHANTAVRRSALADVPRDSAMLASYLRADPACANLAQLVPWPHAPLPLALALYARGELAAPALVELVVGTPTASLQRFVVEELRRGAAVVEAYFDALGRTRGGALPAPPGIDVLDTIVGAFAAATDHQLGHLVTALAPRKDRALARRAAIAVIACLVRGPATPQLLAMLVAFEPRMLEHGPIDPGMARAIAPRVLAFRWPVRLASKDQIERLLKLPVVAGELALAVAVAGLYSGGRLKQLLRALGEPAILDALLAEDRGWDAMCQLPGEVPALELRWLGKIEAVAPARYATLAGRALSRLHGKRLETFIDQIPRRHRPAVFAAFVQLGADPAEPQRAVVCAALGKRLDRDGLVAMFDRLLGEPATAQHLGLALVLARQLAEKPLASAMRGISDAAARRFVLLLDGPEPLPRDRELAIATAFAERADPALRAWGQRVGTVAEPRVAVPAQPAISRRDLDPAQRALIATCGDDWLTDAVAIARTAPAVGLASALAQRAVAQPSLAACVALLGCMDPLDEVARQLDRFELSHPSFELQLDVEAATRWCYQDVPALANARLYRWEQHTLALAAWIADRGDVLDVLRGIDGLDGRLARHTLWRGIAEVVVFVRYRDRDRFLREATHELARFVAERLDRDIGAYAARILVALVEGRAVSAADVRTHVLERAADASATTRELLARIARLDGLPEPPRVVTVAGAPLLALIRTTRDLDKLVAWCRDARTAVVQEAVLGLLVFGEPGLVALASLLDELETLPAPRPLLASIALWDAGPAIDRARSLALGGALPAGWQFQLSVALVERGEPAFAALALAAATAPAATGDAWFRRADWEQLVALVPPRTCALALATSPHHHAYQPAVTLLVQCDADAAAHDALVAFLEVDGERPILLRRLAARRLAATYDDAVGLPLLIEEIVDEGITDGEDAILAMLPPAAVAVLVEGVVDAALIGGHAACTEKRMLRVLEVAKLPADVAAPLYLRMTEGASTSRARRVAAHMLVGEALAHERLGRLAEVFAWGVRRGIELTGRLFRVHLTSKESDLGYTRLDANRVFVSGLPMLREEMHGRDVVEGLILHELGHHVYHRGEAAQALWKQAHGEGIGHLLNLIADEHLERNLRALDKVHGDRLKRLDAYAFHHAEQELPLEALFASLRAASAAALIAAGLGVAFDEAAVRIRRGAILTELDRSGHPLARFARALRMGLGNRTGDPRVAAALALCDRNLRHLDMQGLYDLTRQIAEMFGGAVSIASVFGGAEGLGDSERDEDVYGAGIDDEILQREVERILDPRTGASGKRGPRDRLSINVNPDEHFDPITHVQRVRGTEAEHRLLAADVARHATRLRNLLDELGLRYVPAKARLQGRALDRTRLRALVTRGDPRILTARTPVRSTDLFLGTLIDCSGSMQVGQNIDRAKRFAALIAEAVRPLKNVEARFFGFTDSVIYDAGDAHACDISALFADGGNNDAAALFHAANIAAASPRRAKVLVMISDGLPTQCSVAALRGLVTTLTRRRGIVCAQVAVRALEEACFPHYLVLDDAHLDVAVARFGRMIGDLARRVLA